MAGFYETGEGCDDRLYEAERALDLERRGGEAFERQMEREQAAYEERLSAVGEELEGALAEVARDELIIIDLRQRVGALTTELAGFREGHTRAEQHLRDLLTINDSLLNQRAALRAAVESLSESFDRYRSQAEAGHAEAEHWHGIARRLVESFCGVPGEAGSVDAPYFYREAEGWT